MRTSLLTKKNNVTKAVQHADSLRYKISKIDIEDANQLSLVLQAGNLNQELERIDHPILTDRTIKVLTEQLLQANLLETVGYSYPSFEVFGITFDDGQELDQVCTESTKLQQLVLALARAHDKTLPGKWTNEVMEKFAEIKITIFCL